MTTCKRVGMYTLTFDIDLDRIGGGNVMHIGREILNYSFLSLNWMRFTERWSEI